MLFYGPRTLRRVCPPARAVPPRSSTCPFAAVCIMAPRRLAVRSHTAPKCAFPRVTVAVVRHLSAAFRATPCIFRGYSTRLRLFDLKTPHGATREGGVTVLRRSSAAVRPCDTSCRLLWCVVTAPASALCRRSSAMFEIMASPKQSYCPATLIVVPSSIDRLTGTVPWHDAPCTAVLSSRSRHTTVRR
jgi:hypothetical protein